MLYTFNFVQQICEYTRRESSRTNSIFAVVQVVIETCHDTWWEWIPSILCLRWSNCAVLEGCSTEWSFAYNWTICDDWTTITGKFAVRWICTQQSGFSYITGLQHPIIWSTAKKVCYYFITSFKMETATFSATLCALDLTWCPM